MIVAGNKQKKTFFHFHQAEKRKEEKTTEERKLEKLVRRTSREIYRLRKSKAGKGQLDVISFK